MGFQRTLQLSVILLSLTVQSVTLPMSGQTALVVPGKIGNFDFMEFDSKNERLLVAHGGAGALEIVDLKLGKLLPSITVGDVQGVAIDTVTGTYILGDAKEKKIVFVDSGSLLKKGELLVSGPVDAIAFDPINGMAYAGEDEGNRIWVIDVKNRKLVETIAIAGIPEYIVYETKTDRIYQNIKTKNSVIVINPTTNKIEATWSTLPAKAPHGLAIDSKTGSMFIAGSNGIVVAINLKSGKVYAHANIAVGADQISLDPVSKLIYVAARERISVMKESGKELKLIGDISTHIGAHTLAVDLIRHDVWTSYTDKNNNYLKKFNVQNDLR